MLGTFVFPKDERTFVRCCGISLGLVAAAGFEVFLGEWSDLSKALNLALLKCLA